MKTENNRSIKLPKDVERIIEKLDGGGFPAYAVGGCVRDSLMGKEPSDWDVTTAASPQEIMKTFNGWKIIPTGLKHGTLTLILNGAPYEITTYRVDGAYTDGRRPDTVSFTSKLEEDLARRDFTINAMAYNSGGLVDCFGGFSDLEKRVIRCVGKADDRFSEDYLRMLRAYRFASTLDFELDAEIKASVIKNREKINDISAERIRVEFDKILLSSNFSKTKLFLDDFAEVLFPELYVLKNVPQKNKYHQFNVYEHTLEVLRHTANDIPMKLCALFHDTGKALTLTYDENGVTHFYGHAKKSARIASDILKRLKYDNATHDTVVTIIAEHGTGAKTDRKALKRLIGRIGAPAAKMLLAFTVADTMGKSPYAMEMKLSHQHESLNILDSVLEEKEPCGVKDLAIDGSGVMEILGIHPGKAVGEALSYLLEKVIEEPSLNTREKLAEALKNMPLASK